VIKVKEKTDFRVEREIEKLYDDDLATVSAVPKETAGEKAFSLVDGFTRRKYPVYDAVRRLPEYATGEDGVPVAGLAKYGFEAAARKSGFFGKALRYAAALAFKDYGFIETEPETPEQVIHRIADSEVERALSGNYGNVIVSTKRRGEIRDDEGRLVTDEKGKPVFAYFSGNKVQVTDGKGFVEEVGIRADPRHAETYQIAHELGERGINSYFNVDKEKGFQIPAHYHAAFERALLDAFGKRTRTSRKAEQIFKEIALPVYQVRLAEGKAFKEALDS
jgi:hypothetical protein